MLELLGTFLKKNILCVWVHPMDATSAEDRIGYQMPRSWSYSQLLAALWMPGTEFGSPGRVVEPSLQARGSSLNTLFSVLGDVDATHPGLCGQKMLVLSLTFFFLKQE